MRFAPAMGEGPENPAPPDDATEVTTDRRGKCGGHSIPGIDEAKRLGTDASGTRRITVAVARDQKPPMTIPRRARAIINTISSVRSQ